MHLMNQAKHSVPAFNLLQARDYAKTLSFLYVSAISVVTTLCWSLVTETHLVRAGIRRCLALKAPALLPQIGMQTLLMSSVNTNTAGKSKVWFKIWCHKYGSKIVPAKMTRLVDGLMFCARHFLFLFPPKHAQPNLQVWSCTHAL